MTREQKLQAIWKHTHRDFKGIISGARCILVLRSGGTCSVPLSALTDAEIKSRQPATKREG